MSRDQSVQQPVTPDAGGESRDRWSVARAGRLGAISAAVALVANLLVLVVGTAAGADMSVLPPGAAEAMAVGTVAVIATTVLPVALATGLLVIVRGRAPTAWRALAATGLAVGVLSILLPLAATATGSTKATLAAMHLLTGAVWFVVVRRGAAQEPGRA